VKVHHLEGELVNAAWERMRQSKAVSDYLSALTPFHVQSSIKKQRKVKAFKA
jgi:hypothetical protein